MNFSLEHAGVAARWNVQFSSGNPQIHRAACIRRNEIDIKLLMIDATAMYRTLLSQEVRIPVDANTAAEILRICSKGGRSHSKLHQSENGRRGGLKRCEPKPGRMPMAELWKHRWRKEEMAALRGESIAPPGPLNPEIRCPSACGFTMIAANRVRDILNSGRAFDLPCPPMQRHDARPQEQGPRPRGVLHRHRRTPPQVNEQLQPSVPEPTWTERQLARAAKPEPMPEGDYAHMLRVHDDPVSGTDPLAGQKVTARLSPEALTYLGSLRVSPAPLIAREAAGVSSGTVANWRRQIEGFTALEREAMQDAADTLLASAFNRATYGVLKPVFQLGRLVGYERVYSDKLAEVLLKGMHKKMFAREPEKPVSRPSVTLATPEQILELVRKLSPTSCRVA